MIDLGACRAYVLHWLWYLLLYIIKLFICFKFWSAFVLFLLCVLLFYTYFGWYTERDKYQMVLSGVVVSFLGWFGGLQAWSFFWCLWILPVGSTYYVPCCILCGVWSLLCVLCFILLYGLWLMVIYNIINHPRSMLGYRLDDK